MPWIVAAAPLAELMDLVVAGEREHAADLMRRHVELSLPSLGLAAAGVEPGDG